MDLWKLTDFYGRECYYESLKKAKARFKKYFYEYTQGKNSSNPYARLPLSYQVMYDEWVSVTLVDEGELREYIDRREIREQERQRKHEEWCREAYARREARCKENEKLASGSQT